MVVVCWMPEVYTTVQQWSAKILYLLSCCCGLLNAWRQSTLAKYSSFIYHPLNVLWLWKRGLPPPKLHFFRIVILNSLFFLTVYACRLVFCDICMKRKWRFCFWPPRNFNRGMFFKVSYLRSWTPVNFKVTMMTERCSLRQVFVQSCSFSILWSLYNYVDMIINIMLKVTLAIFLSFFLVCFCFLLVAVTNICGRRLTF